MFEEFGMDVWPAAPSWGTLCPWLVEIAEIMRLIGISLHIELRVGLHPSVVDEGVDPAQEHKVSEDDMTIPVHLHLVLQVAQRLHIDTGVVPALAMGFSLVLDAD